MDWISSILLKQVCVCTHLAVIKISADSDCSHAIKTLAPWKESYDKPRQHIKKQRHHFTHKVCIVKAMVFPVVMYGCESWIIKKVEH